MADTDTGAYPDYAHEGGGGSREWAARRAEQNAGPAPKRARKPAKKTVAKRG